MEKFMELYKDTKQEFRKNDVTQIRSVGIYGSFSRKEEILGWSDLDVMVFIEGHKINQQTFEKLTVINNELSKKHPEINITFRVHSFDEFPEYKNYESSICSYSLFTFYKEMDFIYGEDLRKEMRFSLNKKTINEAINDLLSKLISCRHESRSLISSSNNHQPFTQSFHVKVKLDDQKKYKAGMFSDIILESAMCCNFLKGFYNGRKKEIAKKFEEFFPEFDKKHLPRKANEIRENWNNTKYEITEDFFYESAEFFEKIIELFRENIELNQINNAFEGLLQNDSKTKYRDNVGGIILNEKNEILVVKKDEDKSWQFPQGGIEGSENYEEGLKREIKEELSIEPEKILNLNEANHLNKFDWPKKLQRKKGYRGQCQKFFVVKINSNTPIKIQEEELSSFKWVPIENIGHYITREDLKESFDFIKEEFPSILK